VVVNIVDFQRIMVAKPKDNPPICPDSYGPPTFHVAFQSMKPEAGHTHICYSVGSIEADQNIAHPIDMFSGQATRIVVLVETLEPLVPDRPNQFTP